MEIIAANDRHEDILSLMQEYIDWLMANDDKMKEVLENQHLEDEIADFNSKYAPPWGRLYLALVDGRPAGCAALARLDSETNPDVPSTVSDPADPSTIPNSADPDVPVYCEFKRLFVRPEFRGYNIGTQLTEKIISEAKQIGYRFMRLDTFPFMASAIRLYEYYGFYQINNYCGNPSENALFYELDLRTDTT